MQRIEHYLEAVTLVVALTLYAVVSAGLTVEASPREASIRAAVQHTPVVVGLRLELRRGCLTLALLAQLRQEQESYNLRQSSAERTPSIDESTPYLLLCRLGGVESHQRID